MLVCGEGEMKALGARLIEACHGAGVITLTGDLGTGKTTLVRGALQSCGVTSGVRSPTYTLVEFYELPRFKIAHFDLYRLADPDELEYLGYRDFLRSDTLCLIEWPERALGYLDSIDLDIRLDYQQECRSVAMLPTSAWGRSVVDHLKI